MFEVELSLRYGLPRDYVPGQMLLHGFSSTQLHYFMVSINPPNTGVVKLTVVGL